MGLHRQNAWQRLKPNEQHDWINLRDPAFGAFIELGSKKDTNELSYFDDFSHGVMTTRDSW
jgi:predicted helicase